MGAKSAVKTCRQKTTKWGRKAPPKQTESEGQKAPPNQIRVGKTNSKVTAKAPPSKWKKVVAENAIKMEKGDGKTPPLKTLVMAKRHHISNRGGTLTTTYHIQGAGAPAKTKNYVNADGVYIFSGKGPTFSASCKTSEHYFKKG